MTPAATIPAVLVTGGAGYIGSHAVLALAEAGYRPIVIDDLSTGRAMRVPRAIPFYQASIADTALLARIIDKYRIDAIMHFAGSILVPESVARPLDYYDNNTVNSRQLIATALAAGVTRIVFSSTAAVYGVPDTLPIREDAPTRPINPYGRSKLMTEWMLQDAAAAQRLDYGILRYFNVAGADPRGRSGPDRAQPSHLIEVAIDAARGRRPGVIVAGTDYATPDGSCVRDYVHVSDLADAHVAALAALYARPGHSFTLNCGYGHGASVIAVLDAVDRVLGRKLPRSIGPRRAGDPDALVADNSAIIAQLGWTPRLASLDRIIADALAWGVTLDRRNAA